jgi:hypothetical protein
MAPDSVVDWLMAGDPAIRWQMLRDLAGSAPRVWHGEQRSVAESGWGARLLSLQDADGRWAAGLYNPKWTSTTYTMQLLRCFGLPPRHPQARRACEVLLETGFWRDRGINYFPKRYPASETCISSMVLAILCWFRLDDPRVDLLAGHVAAQQMRDGGWNCRAMPGYGGATHGSFHTTISALEALLEYERFRPAQAEAARAAQERGREFLLRHRMFRSHRTGAVAAAGITRFSFPPRWHYDVLRGLDYFRDSGAERDPRLADAIALVNARRRPDGRWLLQNPWPGRVFFELEDKGAPSRWNTLRALRVLRWWG